MEATVSAAKGTLECVEEAKSPHRILVLSLLRGSNKTSKKPLGIKPRSRFC